LKLKWTIFTSTHEILGFNRRRGSHFDLRTIR
jgi:hypothetical protein